MLKTLPLTLLL